MFSMLLISSQYSSLLPDDDDDIYLKEIALGLCFFKNDTSH